MASELIIPSITETMRTGVIAAARGKCAVTGDPIEVQWSHERRWEFLLAGEKSCAFTHQHRQFEADSKAVIRGYIRAACQTAA